MTAVIATAFMELFKKLDIAVIATQASVRQALVHRVSQSIQQNVLGQRSRKVDPHELPATIAEVATLIEAGFEGDNSSRLAKENDSTVADVRRVFYAILAHVRSVMAQRNVKSGLQPARAHAQLRGAETTLEPDISTGQLDGIVWPVTVPGVAGSLKTMLAIVNEKGKPHGENSVVVSRNDMDTLLTGVTLLDGMVTEMYRNLTNTLQLANQEPPREIGAGEGTRAATETTNTAAKRRPLVGNHMNGRNSVLKRNSKLLGAVKGTFSATPPSASTIQKPYMHITDHYAQPVFAEIGPMSRRLVEMPPPPLPPSTSNRRKTQPLTVPPLRPAVNEQAIQSALAQGKKHGLAPTRGNSPIKKKPKNPKAPNTKPILRVYQDPQQGNQYNNGSANMVDAMQRGEKDATDQRVHFNLPATKGRQTTALGSSSSTNRPGGPLVEITNAGPKPQPQQHEAKQKKAKTIMYLPAALRDVVPVDHPALVDAEIRWAVPFGEGSPGMPQYIPNAAPAAAQGLSAQGPMPKPQYIPNAAPAAQGLVVQGPIPKPPALQRRDPMYFGPYQAYPLPQDDTALQGALKKIAVEKSLGRRLGDPVRHRERQRHEDPVLQSLKAKHADLMARMEMPVRFEVDDGKSTAYEKVGGAGAGVGALPSSEHGKGRDTEKKKWKQMTTEKKNAVIDLTGDDVGVSDRENRAPMV